MSNQTEIDGAAQAENKSRRDHIRETVQYLLPELYHSADELELALATATELEARLDEMFPPVTTTPARSGFMQDVIEGNTEASPKSQTKAEALEEMFNRQIGGVEHTTTSGAVIISELESAVSTLIKAHLRGNAPNFTTHTVSQGENRYSVTVQREDGITPSEMLNRLRREIEELKARNAPAPASDAQAGGLAAIPDLRDDETLKDGPFKACEANENCIKYPAGHSLCRGMYPMELRTVTACVNNYNPLYEYALALESRLAVIEAQEPVGWANVYSNSWISRPYESIRFARECSTHQATEVAVPLYRRPAPVAGGAK